jgi:hypothetical protein
MDIIRPEKRRYDEKLEIKKVAEMIYLNLNTTAEAPTGKLFYYGLSEECIRYNFGQKASIEETFRDAGGT